MIIKTISIFLFICLLSGCIFEDPKTAKDPEEPEKPPVEGVYETKLAFQCLDDQSLDIFAQEITNNSATTIQEKAVSLYIYNKSTGEIVGEKNISKSDLGKFQGVTLSFDPGEYEIRCWGNVGSQTFIYNQNTLSTARLTNVKNYLNQGSIVTDDPLYYGATTLTVPEEGFEAVSISDTIHFKTAHLHLTMEFNGKTDMIPKVEVRNLVSTFNFGMRNVDSNTSYFPEVKTIKESNHSIKRAELNILRTAYIQGNINYDITNNIEIRINDPVADTLINSVNLGTWMKAKGISINPQKENNILSIPDSLSGVTSGITSFPTIQIQLPDTVPTIQPPPIDPPTVPDIDEQGLFFYLYNNKNDIFAKEINSVYIYVYDKMSGNLVSTGKNAISQNELINFQGIRLALPPINSIDTTSQEYEICCWANVKGNTRITDQSQLESAMLTHTNSYNNEPIATNDNLYFARTTAKVTSDYTYVTENINFKAAHTQFTVNIKGMTEYHEIRVSGLPFSFDFSMNSQSTSKSYYPKASWSNYESSFVFNSLRLTNKNKNNVKITLLNSEGTIIHEVSLKDKDIQIDDNSDYNYIYVNGVPTANKIGITIDLGNRFSDDIW
ncbi:MAG: FimB/Mfa2 family fimbrial subunit [Tannerella sp.]|nr:FimB/Mfa2 family fimbrial subunit [Tannerella sp.]